MRTSFGLMLAASLAAPAHAAAAGPLIVESSILAEQKFSAADGSTGVRLAPVTKVVPGDTVVFVLSYRNTGNQPIGDIVLSNPLPAAIGYRSPASDSPAPDLSVDGKTFGTLAALRVPTANGGDRAATVDDITHVRWRLTAPLPAGAQGQFSFQAILK